MKKIFARGNEAVGYGAVNAGCLNFFGYPITPQNEIPEWFARESPELGGVFVQSQSETASINMVYGAASAGVRVMTSTSGPGWGLMQETMSHMSAAETPCVVVLVQRGGIGMGTTRHGQFDYTSATCGAGQGGYKNIVLAPASVQEIHDFVQLAFHLADKYNNPVIVLSDAVLGYMAAPIALRRLEFDPLPEKLWALKGKGNRPDGFWRVIACGNKGLTGLLPPPHDTVTNSMIYMNDKFNRMKAEESRYEGYLIDDADIVLISFGYSAGVCKEVVNQARTEGIKAGLIRPQTVWPFPDTIIREKAKDRVKFLVVEDNFGQMLADVNCAVAEKAPVHFLGAESRHLPTDGGMIMPDRVLERIKGLA